MGLSSSDNPLLVSRDLLVTCRNSLGAPVRATPVRLSRYTALLEIYNPHSILQLSEVLGEFRINIGERCVYAGRGVVSSIVNTGIMVMCEVTLDDGWLDVDLFSPIAQPERLREEFQGFITNWRRLQAISPDFKVAVADFQMLLTELRRWLDQVELGVRSEPVGVRADMERRVLTALELQIVEEANEWFGRFDSVAERVESEMRPAHRAYARRQIHPLVMCSPFVYRTFHKPLGYAGDYEMVNMILREPHEGATLFAKLVNALFLQNPPAQAHRNRIHHLRRRLVEETTRMAAKGKRARIFNLGCGPAREVQLFITEDEVSNHADFTLADFNSETLGFARAQLEDLRGRHGRTTGMEFVEKSIHQLLKESLRATEGDLAGGFDMVYCAGLFDYVSDRVCRRLTELFYQMLAPGGLLLVTNVDASKPFRHSMDYLLEWHLIFRNRQQMSTLLPESMMPEAPSVLADPLEVNLYLETRRPLEPKNG
ncbi:MAG: class I SAM-dependent methyltransferase [Verrucomicrobiales bacterium]|nr:class I SAM-dependent methyltransferase [Verrucomicrobiales bacterium]